MGVEYVHPNSKRHIAVGNLVLPARPCMPKILALALPFFFFSFFWFYDTLLGSNRSRGAAILPLVQELPFAAMVVGLLQHPWFFLTLLRSWLARLLRCGDYRGCWWGGNAPSTKVVWTNLTQLLLWNGWRSRGVVHEDADGVGPQQRQLPLHS